jgi:hypothetical protein
LPGWLDDVPAIAVEVFEDGECAVWLVTRRLGELRSGSAHAFMVPIEVVGTEEQADAPARLAADPFTLIGCGGLG